MRLFLPSQTRSERSEERILMPTTFVCLCELFMRVEGPKLPIFLPLIGWITTKLSSAKVETILTTH